MARNRTGLIILGVWTLCLALAVGQSAGAAQTDEQGPVAFHR